MRCHCYLCDLGNWCPWRGPARAMCCMGRRGVLGRGELFAGNQRMWQADRQNHRTRALEL
jgi:hypothetical protein